MVEMGLLQGEKVELLRGLLVRMRPQKSRHASAVQSLTQVFVLGLAAAGRAAVRVQLPLAVSDDSEPEPDVALVPAGKYRDAHPDQAFLVVEVAETSLSSDREKAQLYATAGIGEYWIVDVVHGVVEVHTDIVDGRYARCTQFRSGETLTPAAFPELSIRLADILG